MKPTQFEAVIFDLDGTLVDTEQLASQTVARAFDSWGVKLGPEHSRAVVGRTWTSALQTLTQDVKLPVPLDEALKQIREIYSRDLLSKLQVIPGAVEAVRDLQGAFRLAVVSGSSRADIEAVLQFLKVRDCFELILGEEDYRVGKPDPEGFLKAASSMRVEPSKVLIFEDSKPGIAAARAGGFWVAALSCANHFGHDQSQAHWKIEDFRKIDSVWIRSLEA